MFNGTIDTFGAQRTTASGENGTNFSASNVTIFLTLNMTGDNTLRSVSVGQNITLYGNISVSAYNLTNYSFDVFVDSTQYFMDPAANSLKTTGTVSPTTNATTGGTNTGDYYNNLTVGSATNGNHTLFVNVTLFIIKGGANSTFAVVTTDTCSCPASGDWIILGSDNCVITTDCNMQGNNVYIVGAGTAEFKALVYSFNNLYVTGTTVICRNTPSCFVR